MSDVERRPHAVDINERQSVQSHFSGAGVAPWRDRYFNTDFASVAFQDRLHAALDCLRDFGGAGMSVLDVGCGPGVEALAIRLQGHRVTACDLSFEMVQLTRQRLSHDEEAARVLVADSEKLPLKDSSFDAVIMLGVIAYSPRPEAMVAAVSRLLVPGGLLIISSVTRRALLSAISRTILGRWIGKNQQRATAEKKPAMKNSRAYRPAELDSLVMTCKFRKLTSYGIDYGRLSYSGRHLMSDDASIALSRKLSRIARLARFEFLQDYARLYVGCFQKQLSE
jgi:2-polyprenyl-3-methyl-5-hydroxy-6-metoxy-1,4-benzoquinol methylase